MTAWEPSAWMREALAGRCRAADGVDADPADLAVLTPLGGVRPRPGEAEDRTCDRCRVYVPPTPPGKPVRFYTGAIYAPRPDGRLALVVFGLCRGCADREGITERAGVIA